MTDIVVRKVSKGKNQNRVTLPKEWTSEYVALKQIDINVFKNRGKYGKK